MTCSVCKSQLNNRFRCPACNPEIGYKESKKPVLKRVYNMGEGKSPDDVDLTAKCNFCLAPVSNISGVLGTITTGFIKKERESLSFPGELEGYHIPVIRKVWSCYSCMGSLDTVLPTVNVSPRIETFTKGRGPIKKTVKDVTHDTVVRDVSDTTPCETFVPFPIETLIGAKLFTPSQCVHCGRSQPEHQENVFFLERKVYADTAPYVEPLRKFKQRKQAPVKSAYQKAMLNLKK